MPALDNATRFHLSLNVNDLAKSVEFLTALLGGSPKKHRPDYAKFEPDDLPLVLSLEPRATPQAPLRNTAGEGPLNHVGIRVATEAQVVAAQRRLEVAGYSTQREDGVECCYATQTKFWVHDNDRTMWEVYVLLADLEHRGGQHDELHAHGPAEPVLVSLVESQIWKHRLGDEFPSVLPSAGRLAEVLLQGTWNAKRHQGAWKSQLSLVRQSLRPGGRLVLHLLTANKRLDRLEPLPGPASAVQVVPRLSDVLNELAEAEFVNVRFAKYGSAPCFVRNGVELRETRLEAFAPAESDPESANQCAIPQSLGILTNSATLSLSQFPRLPKSAND